MEPRIKIFETNKQDGVLCRNKKFYDKDLSEDTIKQIFKETRRKLGLKNGFKGEKMFQANQFQILPKALYSLLFLSAFHKKGNYEKQ